MTLVIDPFELFGNAEFNPYAWEKVPRRMEAKMKILVQQFIRDLSRIPLSNIDENDRVCYICHEEYGSTITVYLKEEPERLDCGHRSGSICITEKILSAPQAEYPVCRKPVVRSKRLSRVEDIKQYLLWYIGNCKTKKNAHNLVTMESFRYGLMKKDISQVISEQDGEKANQTPSRSRDLKGPHASTLLTSLHRTAEGKTGMKVAASEGLSPEQWIMWSMTRTAATCIRYHMPDDVLKTVACRCITDVTLDGYRVDEYYGPSGVSDKHSWVPDVWDKRLGPYDVSRTGVWIDQWCFGFLIFITGDSNPNSGRGFHWVDVGYKED